jgi:microsomal prostaglandin-E synthase 2
MSVILYQFELCPFCHKVKATLDVKGIAYRTVEVNPFGKAELPALPDDAPKKVPVIECDGDVVFDSTTIMNYLDERFPDRRLSPQDGSDARVRSDEIETWVDDVFAKALPTVIYGTWREALKAAQITARSSNFGFVSNIGVRAGGPMIMYQVSKRILKKHGKSDGHAWVAEALDQFEEWLGDDDYVTGDAVSLGDVAMHGAISCVRDFPIFAEMMQRPRIESWFASLQTLRDERSLRATTV